MGSGIRTAVLIPCLNEAATVGSVISGFKDALPGCDVYVYDNGSADGSADVARAAGAVVRSEPNPGKGEVVRRMFAEVDADVYLIADGDGTYNPADAPLLVDPLLDEGLDMVVGSRVRRAAADGRRGHVIGNRAFNHLFHRLFGTGFSDIFSGYRAFSRRFVKSFPATSSGFEIETEISVHASQLRVPIAEIPIDYGPRNVDSSSKLRTVRDGVKILWAMVVLLKNNRPLALFGWISAVCAVAALTLGVPVVIAFIQTGLVERLPTAVLATGLVVVGLLLWALGLILDSGAQGRIEAKRLAYLQGVVTTRT